MQLIVIAIAVGDIIILLMENQLHSQRLLSSIRVACSQFFKWLFISSRLLINSEITIPFSMPLKVSSYNICQSFLPQK